MLYMTAHYFAVHMDANVHNSSKDCNVLIPVKYELSQLKDILLVL